METYAMVRRVNSLEQLFAPSLITVPLKNRIINLAMKAAVRKNLTLEEFMAWAVEGAAKNVEEEKSNHEAFAGNGGSPGVRSQQHHLFLGISHGIPGPFQKSRH